MIAAERSVRQFSRSRSQPQRPKTGSPNAVRSAGTGQRTSTECRMGGPVALPILFRDLVERHDVSHPTAMDELDLASGKIVTRNEDERIAAGRLAISVVPITK